MSGVGEMAIQADVVGVHLKRVAVGGGRRGVRLHVAGHTLIGQVKRAGMESKDGSPACVPGLKMAGLSVTPFHN